MANCSGCPYRWHDSDCEYCSARGNIVLDLSNFSKDTCEYYKKYREENPIQNTSNYKNFSTSSDSFFGDHPYRFRLLADVAIFGVIIFFLVKFAENKATVFEFFYFAFVVDKAKYVDATIWSFFMIMLAGRILWLIPKRILVERCDWKGISITNIVYHTINLGVLGYLFTVFKPVFWKNKFDDFMGMLEYAGKFKTDRQILAMFLLICVAISVAALLISIISLMKHIAKEKKDKQQKE